MINYKFSIFTGEHDPENIPFLLELYDSILSQTYTNWEWIILTNNGCWPKNIPELIRNNNKVSVIDYRGPSKNIGMIKKQACMHCTGDILVEVDHDDLITSDCLEELNQAYQDLEVGFVYSKDAMYDIKNDFVPFNKNSGWTHDKYSFRGRDLWVMNNWAPSSHIFSYIWYTPDHVRTFRKSVYTQIGGYDESAFICDDQDLCIRAYLATKTVSIDKVLYIYRITGNNTSINKRNKEIQIKTKELYIKYARDLANRDADLKNLLKIDLGGGLNPLPGYKTIDLRHTADIVADLNNRIPLPDNSVGVINASHILEHLYDKNKIMSEIYRVLVHGGWAFIDVPSTDGRGAFQDPTHVSYWNENSFLYYTDANFANFIDNKTIRFQEYHKDTYYPNDWMRSMHSLVTSVSLVAIKDGPRLPGSLKI